MNRTISRRTFLLGAGAGALTLSLSQLHLGCQSPETTVATAPETGAAPALPEYRGWEDLYHQRWTWDRVAKGTHLVNCWYQRTCNWNVYVKEGLVFREEQASTYPQTNSSVPDYNPRGCQKGACYSHRMYDPDRLHYPLKRAGNRGEGKWSRVSWDEALTDIADRMIDTLTTKGPGSIYWEFGTALTNGGHGVGLMRSSHILDTITLDANSEIGDHHPGAAVTCGKICFASSADDCFYSDLILIWGGNPVYTQIPNAHFFNESRYNGAQIVTIAPDYNASTVHADLWLPVNVGTDAALGLAMAQVMVSEGLHNEEFIREQTDMPFLLRRDTRRFLRASDLGAKGAEDEFFVYDTASKRVRPAPRTTLALEKLRPALDGEYTVDTKDGPVTVTPVFTLLRTHLEKYTPESTAELTGVPPKLVRRLARQIAGARAATILTQSNFSKFYHGVEMERVQILVLALCGQFGRKGSGFNAFPWLTIEASEAAGVAPSMPLKLAMITLGAQAAPGLLKSKWKGETTEMFLGRAAREEYAKGGFISSTLFAHQLGGLSSITGSAKQWDPTLKRDFDAHLREAEEKGWQLVPKVAPEILFEVGGNFLRRWRGYDRAIDNLLPKLPLLVTVDWRLSATALHSDYVFPAAAWYERDDITWATPIAPFAQATTAATEPLAESKPDWVFHCLLMKKLQERARARGVKTFTDRAGETRRLDDVYDRFTFGNRYTEENGEDFLEALLEVNTNLKGTTWKSLKRDGFARFTSLGMSPVNIGNATDIAPDETITANTWHTEKKQPWPTLTRRMQFYIDHDLYFELGEELPVHKDDPAIGGQYPLQMTGGHTRWSIHASWRASPHLLRLQRGEPVIFMSRQDAEARGIEDGEQVRAHNDVGSFELQAKVSPAVRPGQVVVYHAWEPFQFKEWRSHQVAIPSPMNPIQLAGGYGHIQPSMIFGEPGFNDRGTRLEVERVGA